MSLPRLLEDAGAGLLAQRALGDQRLQPGRRLEVLVPGIVGQGVGHGLDDVRHGVQADHVGGAVGRRLRAADQRAGQRVDLVEAQPELRGVVHGRQDREHADAVADEVRRVLGVDHALAERGGQEGFQALKHGGVGRARRESARPGACSAAG